MEDTRRKKIFQNCIDPSGQEILYLRALQGHSGRNLIDPSLQDNVLIPNDFFGYIYHIGCANQFTLHHEYRIDTRTKSEQKTYSIFTAVNLMNKDHRDLHELDLTKPRLA